MANCILAFPDKTLGSIISAVSGGGTWQAAFPLSNLTLPEQIMKYRTATGQTSAIAFDINMQSQNKIRVVALIGHNFTVSAQVRVRLSNVSNFATTVYDSGTFSVYPNYYDDSSLDYGQPVLTAGKPSTSHCLAMRYPIFITTPAPVSAQFVRVDMNDPGNPDSYLQLSRCFVSPGLEPTLNMQYGASWGLDTLTASDRALNGTPYFNRVEALKTVNFTLGSVSPEAGMGQQLAAHQYLGTDRELFFVADPDATSMSMRMQSFMGRLRQLSAYEYAAWNRGDVGWQVVESV